MPKLKVLSYNIHKGFNTTNLSSVLAQIKSSIELVHADTVFLQEVLGHHSTHAPVAQFEFLADKLWPHYAYGKNSVYTEGHHGNAILSKYPFTFYENIDVSTNKLEKRGILHATVRPPHAAREIHLICLHFDLFEVGRKIQLMRLCEHVTQHVPKNAPLIIAGDFNDWRENASGILETSLGVEEVFTKLQGSHARTFPSWMPFFKLDRIYYRGCSLKGAETLSQGVWSSLSDHAAIYAELDLA